MERAWIVINDDEIEQVLQSEDFHVRPPGELVPPAMRGTELGAVFSRMARMNEGERHATLRTRVEHRIAQFDRDLIEQLAATAPPSLSGADTAAYVIASAIGLRSPEDALPLIRDFAGAIAAGAPAEIVARGVVAAEKLLERMPPSEDPDETANDLGFLFQTYAATGKLIENRLRGSDAPAVILTRRWAARNVMIGNASIAVGDAVVVLLTSPAFQFGAGRHACPGRAIAQTIADVVVRQRTTPPPQ